MYMCVWTHMCIYTHTHIFSPTPMLSTEKALETMTNPGAKSAPYHTNYGLKCQGSLKNC